MNQAGEVIPTGDLSMQPTKNDILAENRAPIAQVLNEVLANLIDLQLQAKQAHWNVKEPNFHRLARVVR